MVVKQIWKNGEKVNLITIWFKTFTWLISITYPMYVQCYSPKEGCLGYANRISSQLRTLGSLGPIRNDPDGLWALPRLSCLSMRDHLALVGHHPEPVRLLSFLSRFLLVALDYGIGFFLGRKSFPGPFLQPRRWIRSRSRSMSMFSLSRAADASLKAAYPRLRRKRLPSSAKQERPSLTRTRLPPEAVPLIDCNDELPRGETPNGAATRRSPGKKFVVALPGWNIFKSKNSSKE